MTKSLKNPKISKLRTDFFKPWGRSSHQTTKTPNLTQPNRPNPSVAESISSKGSSSTITQEFYLFHKHMDLSRHCICNQQGPSWHHPLRAGTTSCSSTTGLALLPPKFRCKLRKAARLIQGTGTAGMSGPKGISMPDSHPSAAGTVPPHPSTAVSWFGKTAVIG